jgi:four helix bundle protein
LVGNFVGNFVEFRMLTHYRLKGYQKALVCGAPAEAFSARWGRRHAMVDPFRRAAESIVLNMAEAARWVSGPDKAKTLDDAIGSTLECAACLDIATIKACLNLEKSLAEKRPFLEIARMLIGLRKSWLQGVMNEDPGLYGAEPLVPGSEALFHHESLDVYQVGLDFFDWFVGMPGGRELTERLCREIDKAATSVVLNVAEGNGRYSELDHRRFLEIATASAVKASACLDLYQQKRLPMSVETAPGREFLSRIVAMLERFGKFSPDST